MDATRPFVGRRREVELLLDRMSAAERGDGGVILVSGPAGIGKTRLIEEALGRYADSSGSLPVGRGLCSDDRGAPALWPWTRALRGWRRAAGAADLTLAPEPTLARGAEADPQTVAAARFQMLTAATDVLLQASVERPLVLVLEDLHWADAESLELLRRVAAEAGTAALLVLATHRDALSDESAAAIADTRRSPAVTSVPLGPLSQIEVGDYLRAIDAPGLTRAPEVHRETGGLPLLLATTSDLNGATTGDLGMVVAGMLAPLSSADREVVETMSILGAQTDPTILATLLETDASTVAAGLRAGRRTGLLGPSTDDGISFAHALLQDAVRRRVDPAISAERHRRAAEVLAGQAMTDPRLAGEVAVHWRQAGRAPDVAREAARWAELAADQAERTLALDDAVRHLRDAADSLRLAGADDAETARLLVRLATAEFIAGRLGASIARCDAAGAAAERAGRPDLVAAAALVVRGVTSAGATAVIERLCRSALTADLPGSTRARMLAQLATCAADSSRPTEAAEFAADALQTAKADGDPVALLDAVRAREMTLLEPADAQERAELGRQAIGLAEMLGQPLAAVIGAGWLLRGAYELARMDLVDEAFEVMEAAADSSGQPLTRWHLLRSAASRAALEGRYAEAHEHNLAALAVATELGDPAAIGMSYAHAAEVATARGRPADLLDGTAEMLTSTLQMPLIRSSRACMLMVLGRTDEAYGLYEELTAELASMVVDVRWAPFVFHLAELAVRFDDARTAETLAVHLDSWHGLPGAIGTPTAYFAGSPRRDLGRLVATAGRLADAEQLLRESIRRNLALRARPYVALSRLDLADVLYRSGSLGEAAAIARQAIDDLRRLEMPGPLSRADQLIGAITTARDDADPLSTRERQIHDLVVKAMSNREIAAELVLSERTVESHVRNVLAKLGCANRTELIAKHALPG